MDEKRLREMAAELAKGIKTQEDLGKLTGFMNKLVIETAFNAEMANHLGYEKNQNKRGSNIRNGYSKKTVISDDGEVELAIPRDRESDFEPQLVKKHQTRIDKINHQILFLYAKGMTTREIAKNFKEMYDVDVSPTLISKVTDSVKEQVIGRQTSRYINPHLVCDALKQALCRRHFPQDVLVYSDRGSQYCSTDLKRLLLQYGLRQSMSRAGNCWDNAGAESFFHTLKTHIIHDCDYKTRDLANKALFEYIEIYYNLVRRHSANG